ncbi:thymidylate synthase [Pseudanabaena phage Pan1]|nr:thymidylate synthase [Pseudanabaena phage Pan1]
MTTLIWNPDVFVMGQTQFDADGLESWMQLNALEQHMLPDAGSPLSALWADVNDDFALERMIEFGGRHCYRSWAEGRDRHAYIRNIIEMEHGSVLEHSSLNLAIQGVSRSLSHELVRHRVGVAISQESQRYVDAKDIKFVVPPLVSYVAGGAFTVGTGGSIDRFITECEIARAAYQRLQESLIEQLVAKSPNVKSLTMVKKRANEAARAHLPNAAETRFLWSPNMRLLRHFLWLRGGSGADLEIRRLAVLLLDIAKSKAPAIFADMTTSPGEYGVPVIVSAES